MRALYFTCALLACLAASASGQAPSPASGPTAYTIFLRGSPIGSEDVTVQSDAAGLTVVTEGRVSAPSDFVIRRAEFKYGPNGSPESFLLDANASGADVVLRTTVKDGNAITEGSQGGRPVSFTHRVSPQAVLHANGIFASYVALAQRLSGTTEGSTLPLYVVPQAEISVRVDAVHDERIQLGDEFLNVRRYELTYRNPSGDVTAHLTTDAAQGRLVSVSVPGQALTIVRADVAASTARTQVFSNPGDEPVTIPVTGFNLGGTLTRPPAAAAPTTPSTGGRGQTAAVRLPAVILLSGSGANDRDGYALGIPTMGQLAGTLAEAGFLVVRFDKRGYGQSGGRAESATLSDFADDARAVMRWLTQRKDVDPKRIALVGHSEGAWVALLAASREKRFAAVVAIAAPGSTGAQLVLEQQQHALDQLNLPAEERERRVAVQKQIQTAVLTGKGWNAELAQFRQQADTPWFQSMLAFDPAKVIDDVRQPLLFIHGDLDRQVPVEHATRISELAKKVGESKTVEVVIVRGINHLLVPATTGEISEYASLPDRTISKDVSSSINGWLTRTFQAVK